jgi:gas vesicle protein
MDMKPSGSFITGLLAGAAIGGVIALLFAPQSGKDTREKLLRKFKELEKELEAMKSKAGEKAGKIRDDLAAKLAELQLELERLAKQI